MTDLKTPYLDSEINGMKFMVRDNSLSVIGTERLEEYQSIKEALKRLEWVADRLTNQDGRSPEELIDETIEYLEI